jgi:Nif-specific regulatory protein
VDIELHSVVDYEEIFRQLTASLADVLVSLPYVTRRHFVLLDPGTPQMQTVWFLLVQSDSFDAVLLQGVPPWFGGGRYRVREIVLDPNRFPIEVRRRDVQRGPVPGAGDAGDAWTMVRPQIVGRSPQMVRLFEFAERAAQFDDVVCITGETGTGKELLARHIHELSRRSRRPFIPVNSAALTEGLVESALFGHVKGSFTGAAADRPGSFRSAQGGTLFLDEVGELSAAVQSKLLRAIDRGEIRPVGVDRPMVVDVRIVVATNRDLAGMVSEGSFRADLYERLQQLPVHLPPLRERSGDVRLLAETFVEQWNDEHSGSVTLLPDAMEVICGYSWPRNVRQLRNTIRRLCMFAEGSVISGEAVVRDLKGGIENPVESDGVFPSSGKSSPEKVVISGVNHGDTVGSARDINTLPDTTKPVDLVGILEETERAWYGAALRQADGNRAEAARLLGIKPPTFRKALRERFTDLA